jgi:hypothetical protein
VGISPTVTNSVVPIAKAPRLSAISANFMVNLTWVYLCNTQRTHRRCGDKPIFGESDTVIGHDGWGHRGSRIRL